MTYTILEINEDESWIRIEVTFDDKSTYVKRMMAPIEDKQATMDLIETWASQYVNDVSVSTTGKADVELTKMLNQSQAMVLRPIIEEMPPIIAMPPVSIAVN